MEIMTTIMEHIYKEGLLSRNRMGNQSKRLKPEKITEIKQAIVDNPMASNLDIARLCGVSKPPVSKVKRGGYD